MKAVGWCLHYDAWKNRGLELLEAMDRVPLLEIQASLKGFGLEEHLSTAIRFKLTQILGSPFAPSPAKPKKPPRKTEKPPAVSQAHGTKSWRCKKQIGAAER